MFTGIIVATGRVTSLTEKGGDLELGIDAAGLDLPRVAIGDEIDLHLGAWRDDRADVAALDHDVPLAAELALPVAHHVAHGRMPRDDRDHPVDPGLADGLFSACWSPF